METLSSRRQFFERKREGAKMESGILGPVQKSKRVSAKCLPCLSKWQIGPGGSVRFVSNDLTPTRKRNR